MRRTALLVLPSVVLGGVVAVASPAAATPASVQMHHTIAADGLDSLYIAADGKVYGTGQNAAGEITGTGERTTASPLTGLPSGVRATAVAAGQFFSLVLGSDGTVYGTGSNSESQLTGTAPDPHTLTRLGGLPAGVKATAISAGEDFTVVLGSNGTVYGTGDDVDGQLTGSAGEISTLTPLSGLGATKAVAVAAGFDFTVVLGANGRVYGTGANAEGCLTGSASELTTLTPFGELPFGIGITEIAAGEENTVLLGTDGYAYATGSNDLAQIQSPGDSDAHPDPTRLAVRGVVAVASGFDTIGLVESGGTVSVAGANSTGQLTGSSNPVTQFRPMTADGSVTPTGIATELVMGASDSLVRDSNGIVYGTGRDDLGQITTVAHSDVTDLVYVSGQKVINVIRPSITGTAKVGSTLGGHIGSWLVTPTHWAYQWKRNGVAIAGATGSSYKLTTADKGRSIALFVTAARPGFTSGIAISAGVGPVAA